MTNAQRDFETYINTQINLAIEKGSHVCMPTRNYSEVLAGILDKALKLGLHVKSHDGKIVIAKEKTTTCQDQPSKT